MRLLITGGSGLLGSKIASISIDRCYLTYAGYNQHPDISDTSIKLDITDRASVRHVFNQVDPDVVVHAAALTNVDLCERDRELAKKVNINGTENVVKYCLAHEAFLVYVSTDYVFSGERGMYKENDDTSPVNFYGESKLEGEEIVQREPIDSCIVRPSVIYGSTPAAGKTNFVLWVIENLRSNTSIKIVDDQWVSPTLNTNLAAMILEIVERKLDGIYHLAGATPINRYEFTHLIADHFELDKNLITTAKSSEMNWAARRPRNSTLNVEKAMRQLRVKPIEVDDALKQLKTEMNMEGFR